VPENVSGSTRRDRAGESVKDERDVRARARARAGEWPSFPFRISTNRVRGRLSGITIVGDILHPPSQKPRTPLENAQARERREGSGGGQEMRSLLIYRGRDQPFSSRSRGLLSRSIHAGSLG